MSSNYTKISVFFLLIIAIACKPKTELYLERGLDILSNKEEVSFDIYKGVTIEEIGVIRDQKSNLKTLVFKLNKTATRNAFVQENNLGVRVWIIDDDKNRRIENWDFKPELTEVNEHKYILKEIKIKEDQIKRMKIYMFKVINGNKVKIGDSLTLNKVNTYND